MALYDRAISNQFDLSVGSAFDGDSFWYHFCLRCECGCYACIRDSVVVDRNDNSICHHGHGAHSARRTFQNSTLILHYRSRNSTRIHTGFLCRDLYVAIQTRIQALSLSVKSVRHPL